MISYYICFLSLVLVGLGVSANTSPSPRCKLQLDRGPCNNYTVKWYYDTHSGRCREFYYSGCQGNQNRFESLEECKAACDCEEENPDVERCLVPYDKGGCNGSYERWHFDINTKQCVCGDWSGCGGNQNLYFSYDHCMKNCGQFAAKNPYASNYHTNINAQNRNNNEIASSSNNVTWTKLFHRQRAQYAEDSKSGKTVILAVQHHTGKLRDGKLLTEHHFTFLPNGSLSMDQYRNISAHQFPMEASLFQQQHQINASPQRSQNPSLLPTGANIYPPRPNVPPGANKDRSKPNMLNKNYYQPQPHITPVKQQSYPRPPSYTSNKQQPGHPAPVYPPQSIPPYSPQHYSNRSLMPSKPSPTRYPYNHNQAIAQTPKPYIYQKTQPRPRYPPQPVNLYPSQRQNYPHQYPNKYPLYSTTPSSPSAPKSYITQVPPRQLVYNKPVASNNVPIKRPNNLNQQTPQHRHLMSTQRPPAYYNPLVTRRPTVPYTAPPKGYPVIPPQNRMPKVIQHPHIPTPMPPLMPYPSQQPTFPPRSPQLFVPKVQQQPQYPPQHLQYPPQQSQYQLQRPQYSSQRSQYPSQHQQYPPHQYPQLPQKNPYPNTNIPRESLAYSPKPSQQAPLIPFRTTPSSYFFVTQKPNVGNYPIHQLSEKEKKDRELRKKLKKDALFAKLKQQEKERWLQMRMKNLKSLAQNPQNTRNRTQTATYSGNRNNSVSGYHPPQNVAGKRKPANERPLNYFTPNPMSQHRRTTTVTAPTTTPKIFTMPTTPRRNPVTLTTTTAPARVHQTPSPSHPQQNVGSKHNDASDESYSEEYDEGADGYDDPLQFFLRMKHDKKDVMQEIQTTDSDGYIYADEETGL